MAPSKTFDPMEGVTSKTTRGEMLDRLKKAATFMHREEKKQQSHLEEIEARLRAKREAASGTYGQELRQAIFSFTDPEWTELIEFLEGFEDLAPVPARRIINGGRILLGQVPGLEAEAA